MHTYKRIPNYYETDQMAIIHHSNYIRWFEEARIDYMNKIGFSLAELEKLNVQIPVVEVSSKYHKTVKFGDEVTILVKMTEFTGIRMNFDYEVYNQNNELCNIGFSKHCFIRPQGKALSLKKVLPNVYDIFAKEMQKGI